MLEPSYVTSLRLDLEEPNHAHQVLIVKVWHQVQLSRLQHTQCHQLASCHGSESRKLVLGNSSQRGAAYDMAAQGD